MPLDFAAAHAISVRADPTLRAFRERTGMPLVILVNGALMMLMGAAMFLDALLFPATRAVFALSGMSAGAVGAALSLCVMGRIRPVTRLHAFLLTASVWITAAGAGALPLWHWGLDATDAAFEAMSAITTTGSTVMKGLDDTPEGILMWRAALQWLGGIGFVVTGIAFLPVLRVGGMQLFRTESSERGDPDVAGAVRFAGATLLAYLALTLACTLAYEAGRMPVFEAVAHAFSTVSTGGFSTSDNSFGQFDSRYLQWTATLFMLAGGLPFAWYIRIWTRGRLRSEQVGGLLAFLGAVIAALAGWRWIVDGVAPGEALVSVAFNVVSVVTTTGFATEDYTLWGPGFVAVFFLLTGVGACTGSTSGGIKAMRWILFLRCLAAHQRRILRPNQIVTVRYEGRPVAPDVVDGVVVFMTLWTVTIACLAAVLGMMELDFVTAISGALTAVANVGPGVGPIIGPAGTFASLPDPAKWALAFGMYAGRLELLTVLVLFTPTYWRAWDWAASSQSAVSPTSPAGAFGGRTRKQSARESTDSRELS